MASRFVSMTNTASGVRFMLRMPLRLVCSFDSSLRRRICSFFGSTAMRPSASMASSSSMRVTRERMVTKFVSMPPSQRAFTYGMPQRFAASETASCACFFVPTNSTVPPFLASSDTNVYAWSRPTSVCLRSMM